VGHRGFWFLVEEGRVSGFWFQVEDGRVSGFGLKRKRLEGS
jgi:hypothetical protein